MVYIYYYYFSPACMDGAIVFGADVTHPSPEQTNIPSIAAVSIR